MNDYELKIKGIGILESEKIYLYYDEPLIFLSKDQFGNRYFMLRQADEQPVWLGVVVSSKRLEELEHNRIEIRGAFLNPENGYVLKVSETNDLCDIKSLTADELKEDMLPFPEEYLDYDELKNDGHLDALLKVYKSVSLQLGISEEEIRSFSPQSMRNYIEKKNGNKIRFVSEFPTIGRGNVLRDNIITREEIDSQIDELLRTGKKND